MEPAVGAAEGNQIFLVAKQIERVLFGFYRVSLLTLGAVRILSCFTLGS